MKKAFSALAIALAIMAGVVFAGYQWTKYQYGGETYYALVGESRLARGGTVWLCNGVAANGWSLS